MRRLAKLEKFETPTARPRIAARRGSRIRIAWKPKVGPWQGAEVDFKNKRLDVMSDLKSRAKANSWIDAVGVQVKNLEDLQIG